MRNALLASFLLAGIALCARADAPARQIIAAKYARFDVAARKGYAGMATWFEANLAPDFVMSSGDEHFRMTMTRNDFIGFAKAIGERMDRGFRGVTGHTTRIDRFTEQGGAVVVVVNERMTGVIRDLDGKYGPKNSDHVMTQILTARDTWRHVAGDWKVTKSEPLNDVWLRDGKPIRQMKK